jgi:hypothetical protein
MSAAIAGLVVNIVTYFSHAQRCGRQVDWGVRSLALSVQALAAAGDRHDGRARLAAPAPRWPPGWLPLSLGSVPSAGP